MPSLPMLHTVQLVGHPPLSTTGGPGSPQLLLFPLESVQSESRVRSFEISTSTQPQLHSVTSAFVGHPVDSGSVLAGDSQHACSWKERLSASQILFLSGRVPSLMDPGSRTVQTNRNLS